MVRTRKPPKLTLAKAIKYYAAGYKEDCLNTLSYFKSHEEDAEALIREMTSIVGASTLEEACKLAVKFDYGCGPNDDPNDWRSHVEGISDIRKAAGHYELDYSAESIVKDLVCIVEELNASLNRHLPKEDRYTTRELLRDTSDLDERLAIAFGYIWDK